MNINSIQATGKADQNELEGPIEEVKAPTSKTSASNSFFDTDTKMALDHATGLLQSIVSDKITDRVIRKMPSDEYLHLLSLLDDIISGSIDKHV